jgi:hypothetical protein
METTIIRHLFTAAGLAGAAILAAAAPAAAATAPVSVVSCSYSSVPRDGAGLIPATAPIQTSNVQISFVNNAPLAATNVRFAVRSPGGTQFVSDAGTFSPGTAITQNFDSRTYMPYNGPAACSVQSVTYSDGSTWQAM